MLDIIPENCYNSMSVLLRDSIMRLSIPKRRVNIYFPKGEKKMKKVLSLVLAVLMCVCAFTMTACSKTDPAKDLETVKKNGKLVIGYTVFDPMNYTDDSGNFVGFDTELAKLVAAELGVEADFQLITWAQKYNELNSGSIDCIWNGFTCNSSDNGKARSEYVDFSTPYANNYQCIVVRSEDAATFTTTASLAGKKCAVEGGSAGEDLAKTLTDADNIVTMTAQIDAFTELAADKVDFIVVDVLLANRKCGQGNFSGLTKTIEDASLEKYAIAFRKDSTLTAEVNTILTKLMKNGKIEELSAKYGVPLTEDILALKNS